MLLYRLGHSFGVHSNVEVGSAATEKTSTDMRHSRVLWRILLSRTSAMFFGRASCERMNAAKLCCAALYIQQLSNTRSSRAAHYVRCDTTERPDVPLRSIA